MISPTLTLLFRRPELIADHLAGYGELALAEVVGFKRGLLRQLLFAVLAVVICIVALSVSGVALLLGLTSMVAPHWALWAVPLALFALAAVALFVASRPAPVPFPKTREQLQTDIAWLSQRDENNA